MKNLLIFLMILFYSPITIFSQTFHLGLKAEFYGYIEKEVSKAVEHSSEFSISPLPSFYVIAGYDISKTTSLLLMPGISFRPVSANIELGFVLNHNLFSDRFFLTAGPNFYFGDNTIYFIKLGAGYKLTERLSLDISFHQSLNQDFAFSKYNKYLSESEGPSRLVNMLKIGFAAVY